MNKGTKAQLEQEGVRLIVKDCDEFVQKIDRATEAVERLTTAIERLISLKSVVINTSNGIDPSVIDARMAESLRRALHR